MPLKYMSELWARPIVIWQCCQRQSSERHVLPPWSQWMGARIGN